MIDSEYWARYYEVTVDRPSWTTVKVAIELFAADDAGIAAARGKPDRVEVGGRVVAMLFGDHDGSADDASMTCPPPDSIRESLASFEIEHWADNEEDTKTALGEPHHFHTVELVARRIR